MRYYKSDVDYMRGTGVGSIFSSIVRGVSPFLKTLFNVGKSAVKSKTGQNILKNMKKEAYDSTLNLTHDILSGKNVKQATKDNIAKSSQNVLENIKKNVTFSNDNSVKKKRSLSVSKKKKGTKKKKNNKIKDIFS